MSTGEAVSFADNQRLVYQNRQLRNQPVNENLRCLIVRNKIATVHQAIQPTAPLESNFNFRVEQNHSRNVQNIFEDLPPTYNECMENL
jgi:hypothetical protein